MLPPHLSPPMTRRRASLRAARAGKRVTIGFAEEGSHRLIDLQMCAVLDPRLFALVDPLRSLLALILPDKRAAHVKMSLIDQGVDLLLEGVRVEGLAADEGLGDFARSRTRQQSASAVCRWRFRLFHSSRRRQTGRRP